MLYAWNVRDEESEEEYRQIPSYLRDLFFNIKLADNFWLRIPKGFNIAVLTSGASRLVDATRGNKNAFEGYGGSFANSVVPMDATSLYGGLKPIAESIFNWDSFRNRHIKSIYEEGLAIKKRDVSKASRIGQMLQKWVALNMIDARDIDHYLRGQFAGFGSGALTLSDLGHKDKWISTAKLANVFFGLTVDSPAGSSRDVQYVYTEIKRTGQRGGDLLKRLRSKLDSWKKTDNDVDRDAAAKQVRLLAAFIRRKLERGEILE
jgi:hypothetical protein